MCSEINKQHKTILSMYYHDRLAPRITSRAATTIDLDLTELLLLMEAIFGVIHHRISINSCNRTDIVNNKLYFDYDILVSKEEILCDYRVLEKNFLCDYQKDDYQVISDYGAQSKNNLFYYNALTTYINCTHSLKNRKSFMHYILYDKEGKKIIKYLKNRLIELINRMCHTDVYGTPCSLVESMIEDYHDLEALFEEANQNLKQLRIYSNRIGKSFNLEFANEKLEMNAWIQEHDTYKDSSKYSLFDFIFLKSKAYYNLASELIYQISVIIRSSNFGDFSNNWLKCIVEYDHTDSPREMKHVNQKLSIYENSVLTTGFEIVDWGEEYIKRLTTAINAYGF